MKEILRKKLGLDTTPLESVSAEVLVYYLKPWCKLLARNYNPILNLCSGVISAHSQGQVTAGTFASAEFQLAGEKEGDSHLPSHNNSPAPSRAASGSNPAAVDPNQVSEAAIRPIARDDSKLWRLCTQYSTAVIESICLVLTDPSTLTDQTFLTNLQGLVSQYNVRRGPFKSFGLVLMVLSFRPNRSMVLWITIHSAPGLMNS